MKVADVKIGKNKGKKAVNMTYERYYNGMKMIQFFEYVRLCRFTWADSNALLFIKDLISMQEKFA